MTPDVKAFRELAGQFYNQREYSLVFYFPKIFRILYWYSRIWKNFLMFLLVLFLLCLVVLVVTICKTKMASVKIYDIFCIFELVTIFVIIGCLSDEYIFGPVQHYATNQFCHGGIYGMVLVLLPLLYGLCANEPRPKKTGLIVAATGAIVFVAAAVLMILEIEEHVKDKHKDQYNRLMAGAAITLVLGVIFFIHFITVLIFIKRKKLT